MEGAKLKPNLEHDLLSESWAGVDNYELIDIPVDSTMVVDASALVGALDDDNFWLPQPPLVSSSSTVISTTDHDSVGGVYTSSSMSVATMVSDQTFTVNPMPVESNPIPDRMMTTHRTTDSALHRFREAFYDVVPFPEPVALLYPLVGAVGGGGSDAMPKLQTPTMLFDGTSSTQLMGSDHASRFATHTLCTFDAARMALMSAPDCRKNAARRVISLSAGKSRTSAPSSVTIASNSPISCLVDNRTKSSDSTSRQSVSIDVNNSTIAHPKKAPRSAKKRVKVESPVHHRKSSSTKRKAESDLEAVPSPLTPIRALTPYNYFFRFERDRLLKFCAENVEGQDLEALLNCGGDNMPPEYLEHYNLTPENSAVFQEQLLQDQWSRDPTVKRKHTKSHGKISFQSLAKRISKSWKVLPQQVKDVFRDISKKDFDRYTREVVAQRRLQLE